MPVPGDELALLAAVSALLADYADCIDRGDLEAWPGFFAADGCYRITSAFNHRRGLPVGIIDARNRAMLEDRVASLRRANVFETQAYRHIISLPRVTGRNAAFVEAEAGFMVVRTMQDGVQDLFVCGRYLDRIDFSGARPLYLEKLVVLDSDKIDTLLAIPL